MCMCNPNLREGSPFLATNTRARSNCGRYAACVCACMCQPIHTHADKIEQLNAIDFGEKAEVEEGAIVRLNDRYFVISVSTARFECDGESFMGISPQAPIYQAMQGKRAGEKFAYGDRQFDIQAVY